MSFTLKQLQAFVWVADLGSFRRAAERLNTTQPNISTRIAGLEAALKTPLMERDAGSVRLTAKGHDLLAHARDVLRASETLIAATDDPSLIAGTLRLGVTEMVVHTWLREFLKQLKRPYPNLNVELTVDLSVSLEKSLNSGLIDLALQNAPFTTETTGRVALGQYPSIWVAAKALGLHQSATMSAAELTAHPLLTHARNTRSFEEISAHFSSKTAHVARLVPSSNLAACVHMAVEGMGVAALPAAMVAREMAQGDLVAIPYPWHPQDLEFYARFDAHRAPAFVAEAAQLAAEVAATAR